MTENGHFLFRSLFQSTCVFLVSVIALQHVFSNIHVFLYRRDRATLKEHLGQKSDVKRLIKKTYTSSQLFWPCVYV